MALSRRFWPSSLASGLFRWFPLLICRCLAGRRVALTVIPGENKK